MSPDNYVKKILQLNSEFTDRLQFHDKASKILVEMGQDKEFWHAVFKQNLKDEGYLKHKWTMYEIPFFIRV